MYASTTVGVRTVSITGDVRAPGSTGGGADAPAERYGDSGYDRTPPQDIAAEQCVLGGMLLSKDAIADVVEILRSGDFYRPAHATLFDVILDMYGRGEPADAITVAAVLTSSGDLSRVGGAAYLHTLISSVPTAANSAYYARIVAERAVLRRLVEAGTRIVQMGYGSAAGQGRDVDDIVDLAQQAVYDVTERRISEDFVILADLLQPALDEIESVGTRDGVMSGVPTGFGDLDRLLNGLHPGQLIVVAGRPGLGKALALDTPLPTPDGWTTMVDVRIGDRLIDAAGRPTVVTALSDIMLGRPCYEVEFSDGAVIVADAEHRWLTHTRATRRHRRRPTVRTTERIGSTLRTRTADRRINHSVDTAMPLDLPDRDLPVAPYTLGVWLGGGQSAAARFTTADQEIAVYIEADGYLVDPIGPVTYSIKLPSRDARHVGLNSVTGMLRELGVLGAKHIPAPYLRASVAQRRALLAGLLDAVGTVDQTGNVQFSVPSRRLAQDLCELIVSLGYGCTVTSTVYSVGFFTSDDVFRLERKRLAHKEICRTRDSVDIGERYIVDVRRTASVPVRCVSVDNPDHLYLAGRAMIPTHNSTVSMDFARTASVRHNLASAIFSLEMSKIEIVTRLLAAEARVPLHVLRSGQLSDDDWTRLARRMGEISEAPIFVDDTPNMTLMEIRAKARRMRQRHDLKLVIVDYLQLMTSPKRVESRQQEVAELSRGLKLLAKEIECPVVAVSQLNRGPEQRTDKRPQLADLRESGCLTASTRLVRADTNEEVTLGELCRSGATDIPVWALDERLKYVPRTLTHAFPSGRRIVHRMRLASGHEIEATGNHRFLTVDGWTPLDQLSPGSRIAVPRHIPPPLEIRGWRDEHVILLAHLLGDGSFVRRQPIQYTSADAANLEAVCAAALSAFGISAIEDENGSIRATTLRLHAPFHLARGRRNPIAEWLDGFGLFGARSHEKFIPGEVFSLPKRQVALFLRHLWATDGSVVVSKSNRDGFIYYRTTSSAMLHGVRMLLLRFGIVANSRMATLGPHRPQYALDVSDREDQLRFLREIGAHGARGDACDSLRRALAAVYTRTNVDTVPPDVWARMREALVDPDAGRHKVATGVGMGLGGSTSYQRAPSQPIARVATVLGAADLDLHATNDVIWDEVSAIEDIGEHGVFDATVVGLHNFVANGIVAHNSIEQDADVVILLHRDDYYDKESPRAGEADFIVAKHRNGPTDTVTVAAQLHFSRFVDMAIS